MKAILIILVCCVTSTFSLAQTLNPPEVKSANDIVQKLSLNDEVHHSINPTDIMGSLFAGEGDIIDSTQYWSWNSNTNEWELLERIFYTSDVNGLLLSETTLNLNGTEWVNFSLTVNTYDTEGNLLIDLSQIWNGSAWENSRQTLYTYDTDNNQTSLTNQNWDGSAWVNANHLLYTYDDQHNRLTRTSGLWLGSEWSNGINSIYTYDGDNKLILHEIQHWDSVAYVTDQQILYVYTPEGDLDTSLTQSWETDHWEDVSRNIFEYDANHNRTFFLNQMAVGDGTWIDVQRFTFTFDSDNNITGQLYESFTSGEWINEYRFLLEYDTRQNRITEVFQLWVDEWVNQDSFHYYYTLETGIGDVLTLEKMKLYPNPVNTTLNIDQLSAQLSNGTFTIFSQSGLRMIEGEMKDLTITNIDVSKLMPGSYYILTNGINCSAVEHFIKLQD